MKTTIQILPENLCNKIAAGEVVERPSSVVKELVENSLDAGAAEIRIEVEKGGKRLIRVVDDGAGMGRDDVFLALERHATSKIRRDDDLFHLNTLGFRGEALPSIASVCRMQLRSCPEGGMEGWEILAEGGTVKRAGAVGMARGTTIEVRDLFFNTPARRKFLRRDETELGHIADVVTRLALGRPGVRFRLVHNGKTVIDATRQGGLPERVASLLGRPLVRDLQPVEVCSDGLSLRGLAGQPALSRAATSGIYTFINGRYIRDRVVQHAILEGYRNLLEKGRYPVVVLFLELDPAQVDVNVHPTKHEVRFREQSRVHDFIAESIRRTLRPAGWLSPVRGVPGSTFQVSGSESLPPSEALAHESEPAVSAPPETPSGEVYRHRVGDALQTYARTLDSRPAGGRGSRSATPFRLPAQEGVAPPKPTDFFSGLTVIGQFRRSYILAQDGDDLILVDQHAAHERIGFERLKAQFHEEGVERQDLLFPPVLELEHREADALLDDRGRLERLGFEVEPFGGRSLLLKSVPRLLAESDPEGLIRDVAGDLAALGSSGRIEEALDRILITMACHGMIRANQTLALPQIEALLRDLDTVDFSANCPHGRPVMKRLTLGEVERMFRRG